MSASCKFATSWLHHVGQPEIECKRFRAGCDPTPLPIRVVRVDHQIVLARRDGAGYPQGGTLCLIAPIVTDRLCSGQWIFRIPVVRESRDFLDLRFRNIKRIDGVRFKRIESLVVNNTFEDGKREAFCGIVEMPSGGMPASVCGKSAQPAERSLPVSPELAQDDSPGSHRTP